MGKQDKQLAEAKVRTIGHDRLPAARPIPVSHARKLHLTACPPSAPLLSSHHAAAACRQPPAACSAATQPRLLPRVSQAAAPRVPRSPAYQGRSPACARHGLVDLAQLRSGETLLVLGGSGGVGLSAIAIGLALGARVVAAASSDARLDACRQARIHARVVAAWVRGVAGGVRGVAAWGACGCSLGCMWLQPGVHAVAGGCTRGNQLRGQRGQRGR